MMEFLRRCWFDEDGQDLTEYALMLAFVVVAGAAIFAVSGASIMGIWTKSNENLAAGNAVAAS
jgi:Flp pilus assembly pilin Flp